jgi:hypothetical protein
MRLPEGQQFSQTCGDNTYVMLRNPADTGKNELYKYPLDGTLLINSIEMYNNLDNNIIAQLYQRRPLSFFQVVYKTMDANQPNEMVCSCLTYQCGSLTGAAVATQLVFTHDQGVAPVVTLAISRRGRANRDEIGLTGKNSFLNDVGTFKYSLNGCTSQEMGKYNSLIAAYVPLAQQLAASACAMYAPIVLENKIEPARERSLLNTSKAQQDLHSMNDKVEIDAEEEKKLDNMEFQEPRELVDRKSNARRPPIKQKKMLLTDDEKKKEEEEVIEKQQGPGDEPNERAVVYDQTLENITKAAQPYTNDKRRNVKGKKSVSRERHDQVINTFENGKPQVMARIKSIKPEKTEFYKADVTRSHFNPTQGHTTENATADF